MPPPPDRLLDLVERFERGRSSYLSSTYNETQTRREFIDPLFEELGWDVSNTAGYAEAYKDVVHEDRLTIAGQSKAPDYSFRVGGARKFFVEAKKPSVNLQSDRSPAFQLRRYAWNAKLPLSVLTDFDEFAVYDCRHEPKPTDPASTNRILYLKSHEYLTRWDEIVDIFSKEAVLRGSFDSFAVSVKGKRGTSEVDKVFLAEMETWRSQLAKNLVLRNELNPAQLNFAVQQTLDRLVFLRISEDRGIEPYAQLLKTLDSTDAYSELVSLFQRADEKYNSGLFHFKHEPGSEAPDSLTPTLRIDHDVLRRIISRLYYPASPYNFKVMPPEILGQVYERFLGQVIRLTASGRAVVEPKPAVRKAGGVYYTPSYVVERIVDRTLMPVLKGLNPSSAGQVRVLDPACGSGSFLLVAFDRLLKWHLNYYESSKSKSYRNRIYKSASGEFSLTVQEKRRILLNNIYGVDIDSQAVEVTKLSLLLKVLEDESSESLAQQLKLFSDRALPNLHENIKCGNSLIQPDYFADADLFQADQSEINRVNPFDWVAEFPEIMKEGGFDAVIGNPPYVFSRDQFTPEERSYYASHYPLGWEKRNTYLLFMELLQQLLRKKGRGAYIVPNSWLTVESARLVRDSFAPRVLELIDLNYPVFEGAVVEPSIFVVSGKAVKKRPRVSRVRSMSEFMTTTQSPVDRTLWERSKGRFVIPGAEGEADLVDYILNASTTVGETFDVRTGLQAYEAGKGTPRQTKEDVRNHVYDRTSREDENSYRYLQGRDVRRFAIEWSGMWMQHGPWLSQPRTIDMFTRPRVLVREITSPLPHSLSCCFTDEAYLSNKSVLTVLSDDDDADALNVLSVILNSRLISLCYRTRAVKSARKVFPKIVVRGLAELPFPRSIDPSASDRALELTEQVSAARARAEAATIPREREVADREAQRLGRMLELTVCRMFGLDDGQADLVLSLTEPDPT